MRSPDISKAFSRLAELLAQRQVLATQERLAIVKVNLALAPVGYRMEAGAARKRVGRRARQGSGVAPAKVSKAGTGKRSSIRPKLNKVV